MEDKRPIHTPDVLLGRGVHAEMGEVLFQDGEFRGGGCGGGDLVVFCATVLDDHLKTFGHRIERAHRQVRLGARVTDACWTCMSIDYVMCFSHMHALKDLNVATFNRTTIAARCSVAWRVTAPTRLAHTPKTTQKV